MALVVRFLTGFGNGFMGIAKTAMSEIVSSKEQEVLGFGYLNGVWGLGMIVGPIIGGFLSRPAIQYPVYFKDSSIWGRYPYLLPCLTSACIALLAFAFILCYLPETLNTGSSNSENESDVELAVVSAANRGKDAGSVSIIEFTPLSTGDYDEDEEVAAGGNSSPKANGTECNSTSDAGSDATLLAPGTNTKESPAESGGVWGLLTSSTHQLLLAIYLCYSFAVIVVDEVFPLWCVSSLENGGLSWEPTDIGIVMSIVGVGLVLFQLFLYEPMMKTFFNFSDTEVFFRQCLLCGVPIALIPYVVSAVVCMLGIHSASASRHSLVVQAVMIPMFFVYSAACGNALSAYTIVVNASVPQAQRGMMNGLIMTAGSIGNFVGPVAGSAMYAYLLEYGSAAHKHARVDLVSQLFVVDGKLIFVIGGLLTVLVGALTKWKIVNSSSGANS